MQTDRKNCLVCNSNNTICAFKGKDRLYNMAGVFDVMKCTNCDCFFRLPCLNYEDLKNYYPVDNYKAYLLVKSPLSKTIERLGYIKKRRYISGLMARGKLLDVGCATGSFLEEMRRSGWAVEGIEPSEPVAEIARKRGHRVITGTLENSGFPPENFDVVTMWHVLEHVQNPLKDLLEAKRVLKKGGLLVFCIPNLNSLEVKIFRRLWAGFDIPRHSYVYSRKGLNILFNKTGLEVKQIRFFFGGFDSFNYSLGFFIDERCPF